MSGYMYSDLEREGLLAVLCIDGEGRVASVEARPIILREQGWGSVPSDNEARIILNRFSDLSTSLSSGHWQQESPDRTGDLVSRHMDDFVAAWRSLGLKGLITKVKRLRIRHVRRFLRTLSVRSSKSN